VEAPHKEYRCEENVSPVMPGSSIGGTAQLAADGDFRIILRTFQKNGVNTEVNDSDDEPT